MTRRLGVQRLAFAVVVALTAVGCSIRVDDEPRDIAEENRRELERGGQEEPGTATGATRVFLIAPSEANDRQVLRSVLRDSAGNAPAVTEELLRGPNDAEVGAGLRTEVPPGLRLLSASRLGDTVVVNMSDEMLDVSGDALILAVAQIVATLTQLDGVTAVRLTVEGDPDALTGGSATPLDGPLTVYDFAGLIESSQPAVPGLPSR